MEIPEKLERIEVYYDGRCGMCCTFHEWVNKQNRAFAIDFIPYQNAKAEEIFPGIGKLEPEREMVVRTDAGQIFRGAEAWVLCLYSCKNHQKKARRLGGPVLLPVAIRMCRLLAANRHRLSKVFFRKKDKAVLAELHKMPAPEGDCKEGGCRVDA